MKNCPYCGSSIPETSTECPSCQADYWEPDQSSQMDTKPALSEQEDKGCLSIILIPILLSAAVAAILVMCGFIINLFLHFESNQIKILWICVSCLFGLMFYRIFTRLKKSNEQ